jgi:hypothetical protein
LGGNSTTFSLPTTAPFEEIVPSALIATCPGGMAIGPLSPITVSPELVTS